MRPARNPDTPPHGLPEGPGAPSVPRLCIYAKHSPWVRVGWGGREGLGRLSSLSCRLPGDSPIRQGEGSFGGQRLWQVNIYDVSCFFFNLCGGGGGSPQQNRFPLFPLPLRSFKASHIQAKAPRALSRNRPALQGSSRGHHSCRWATRPPPPDSSVIPGAWSAAGSHPSTSPASLGLAWSGLTFSKDQNKTIKTTKTEQQK